MTYAPPCNQDSHDWVYEGTLTPPISGSHLGGSNITIYRCTRCQHSWDGTELNGLPLVERTPAPAESAEAIVDHYTGESVPGVKNVEARNRKLSRRLHKRPC